MQVVGSECDVAVCARGPRTQVATNVLVTLWLPRALLQTPRRDRAHARRSPRPPSGAPGIPAWGRPGMRIASRTHAHTHRGPAGAPGSRTPRPPPAAQVLGRPAPQVRAAADRPCGGRRAEGGRCLPSARRRPRPADPPRRAPLPSHQRTSGSSTFGAGTS